MSPPSRLGSLLCDPRVTGALGSLPRTISYLRGHTQPSVGLGAQVWLDEFVLAVLRNPKLFPTDADIREAGADVIATHGFFSDRGWLEDPAGYHQAPAAADDLAVTVRGGSERWTTLTFPVSHEPHPGEPGRDRWLQRAQHRTAYASILRHREPGRPWLIAVHGFAMGDPKLDLKVFRGGRFHDELGMNLALPVLPSHGARRGPGQRTGEGFMSVNIVDGIHGVAQAAWEIRSLIAWIRAEDPGARIAVHGISLGGCVASVVASLEPGLAGVIAGIPVSDLFELYRTNSSSDVLRSSDELGATGPLSEEIARVISPLSLSPQVPHERRFIVAGLGDRMSTTAQAERLWQHWGRPGIDWYPGGHVGYFMSRDATRATERAIRTSLFG
jgi:hypothetical protein